MSEVTSQGTKFEVQLASAAYQEICSTSISGLGGGAATEIDITTLCSTGKEFAMGLKDEGTISLSTIYDPADVGMKRLQYLRDNQDLGVFRVTLPDTGSETWSFSGYVTAAALGDVGPDTVLTMNFSIRVTGSITVA